MSERNLHNIFEQAQARKRCVLFLDELDAIGFPPDIAGEWSATETPAPPGRGRTIIEKKVRAPLDKV